ncbi:PemK family transcriptional regulator [Rubritalea profundi]|uniref:mRNA interferase n=1 Tax=Rubritalea profundi TaxID=1658618 RepID=A0A2S7U748_9BACT|nr:PemK family transcriptional regulator [Rubritalea profundi]
MKRGEIWWVSLDPTQGSEIRKTRPCVVMSHNTLNQHRQTVIVVPLSTAAKAHPPITIPVTCKKKQVMAVVDQVRAVSKHRLKSRLDNLEQAQLSELGDALKVILSL